MDPLVLTPWIWAKLEIQQSYSCQNFTKHIKAVFGERIDIKQTLQRVLQHPS